MVYLFVLLDNDLRLLKYLQDDGLLSVEDDLDVDTARRCLLGTAYGLDATQRWNVKPLEEREKVKRTILSVLLPQYTLA